MCLAQWSTEAPVLANIPPASTQQYTKIDKCFWQHRKCVVGVEVICAKHIHTCGNNKSCLWNTSTGIQVNQFMSIEYCTAIQKTEILVEPQFLQSFFTKFTYFTQYFTGFTRKRSVGFLMVRFLNRKCRRYDDENSTRRSARRIQRNLMTGFFRVIDNEFLTETAVFLLFYTSWQNQAASTFQILF